MKNSFQVAKDLYSFLSYKGLPFPKVWFPTAEAGKQSDGDAFRYGGDPYEFKKTTELGTTLRKEIAGGKYYFLPVVFIHNGKNYEIPNAIIGYNCKKNIVETALTGRRGTVKELISIADYEINIAGVAVASDFPEKEIKELNELFKINESIEIKCALTELFLEADDKVIIKSMEFAEMTGTETIQTVKISCVTDQSFDLIIE